MGRYRQHLRRHCRTGDGTLKWCGKYFLGEEVLQIHASVPLVKTEWRISADNDYFKFKTADNTNIWTSLLLLVSSAAAAAGIQMRNTKMNKNKQKD